MAVNYEDLKMEVENILNMYPNLLNEIKDKTAYCDYSKDKGIVNNKSGSSILVRENGDTVIASSLISQVKSTSDGHAIEQTIESITEAVRRRLNVDEIIINDHKLNPALYELTDMKTMYGDKNQAIGDLTLCTTVLVKAWEPTLKKWVLIRRPARTYAFSPILNLASTPEELSINDDISNEILNASPGGRKNEES